MGELINGRTPEQIRFNVMECAHGNCLSECPYDIYDECTENLLDDAFALIRHLEAKVPKWISVEERLPEQNGIYLAHVVHRYCKIDSYWRVCIEYFGIEGTWDSLADIYEVTHWMPLPEPPEVSE